jgi:hypothetical protein
MFLVGSRIEPIRTRLALVLGKREIKLVIVRFDYFTPHEIRM